MNPFQINRDRSIDQDKVFLVDKLFQPIRNGEIYPVSDLQIVANLNSNWECSFTVYRETDGVSCPLWDQITDFALVKIENKGIFELEAPITDEAGTYKQCSGKSICEAETSQTLMTLEINTEDDIARESETDPTAAYYQEFPTVFYRNVEDTSVFDHLGNTTHAAKLRSLSREEKIEILRRSSLLHRVFSEMPEYLENITENNVDDSLKNLQYTFSWSAASVYDICQDIAEEIQCIFIFDPFSRSFQVRDLKDHCEIDHCRDIQDGICPLCRQNGTTQKIASFGKYSGVEIDTRNLAETITLSGNKDSVKNYFKVEGADDIITDRISNRLIGNGYIWKTGALQRSQMSAELVAALDAREQMMTAEYPAGSEYQNIQDEYNKLWDQWNALESQKLDYQSGMMPSPEMADKNAEYIYHDLFGVNGKINCAYASNQYQSDAQIADSVIRYAKLLIPTNHNIEYTNLSHKTTQWNGQEVVKSISFQVHVYLDGHYQDGDESRGYADEYPPTDAAEVNKLITLPVVKGYDISYTEGDHNGIYTTDYYNYLKHLVDTDNAKAGITEESICFDPITPIDIDPDAAAYNDISLKATHYSKYCYNRLYSFCKAYEACSSVVSKINNDIASNTTENIPSTTTTLSGDKVIEIGKNYFVVPLHPDLSYIKFYKDEIYTFQITSSASIGFSSSGIGGLLAASGNVNPGGHGLHPIHCKKTDEHTYVLSFKGDGKKYSHLCIALANTADYNYNHSYHFSASIPSDTSNSPTKVVEPLQYLSTDNTIRNIQADLLGKYQEYMTILSERMHWLQEQIDDMEQEQNSLMDRINEIKEICDMEHYLSEYKKEHNIGRNLWHELCSFKRQDTYRNDNFIGEGIDDTRLMENVENLLKRAEEEIESASNITYSASATISNLLTLPEFEPFWDKFTLGNYIHMVIDQQIYTMRLISITYDYNELSHCSVEFSNVIRKNKNGTEDIADILSQASSLASSAKTTARQAEQGAAAKLSVDVIKNDALNLANSRIITADDQNFVIDKYGITGKYIDPISAEISDEQIRIINNLLCFTDDNWQHTKTALGKITYRNPNSNQYETRYGLIADTLIGNLILGEKLIICDQNGYVRIDGNGIELDGGAITWKNKINQNAVISQNAVTGLPEYMAATKELQSFQDNVKAALGLGTTINSKSIISPNIGGGYLYIVDENNSITLNPHTGTVSDGTHTSTSNMLEIVSNNKTVLCADKNGNLQLGSGQIGTSGIVLLSPGGIDSETSIAGSFGTNRWAFTANNTFGVTTDGKLYAENAEISGRITATSGSFSGDVTSNSINMTGGNLHIPINTDIGETEDSEKITVSTEKLTPGVSILSGSKVIEATKNYFVVPLNSDNSPYTLQRNTIYKFTISTTATLGFMSKEIGGFLANSPDADPSNCDLHASKCIKQDMRHFTLFFKGDGKPYSYLCICLTHPHDYNYRHSYTFDVSVTSEEENTVSISPSSVSVCQTKLNSTIASELKMDGLSCVRNMKKATLSLDDSGKFSSNVDFYAPNLQEKEWKRITRNLNESTSVQLSTSSIFSTANEIIVSLFATNSCGSYGGYTWHVDPDTVPDDDIGVVLLSGYKTGSFEGIGEISLNRNAATVNRCMIINEDLMTTATLTISYR